MQAITAGTSTSARLVSEDTERGTIAPGKMADLLLVKGAPDQNIEDIEQTAAVFLGGQQLDLSSLESVIQSPQFTSLPSHRITRNPATDGVLNNQPRRVQFSAKYVFRDVDELSGCAPELVREPTSLYERCGLLLFRANTFA
jgi:hypothetical protein